MHLLGCRNSDLCDCFSSLTDINVKLLRPFSLKMKNIVRSLEKQEQKESEMRSVLLRVVI